VEATRPLSALARVRAIMDVEELRDELLDDH
jgi:hypothetical protein